MPSQRSRTSAVLLICAVATGSVVLAIIGAVHRSWGLVAEGLVAAVLLYGLLIRTALRQRR